MKKITFLIIFFYISATYGQMAFEASYKKEFIIPYDKLEAIKDADHEKYERYLFLLKKMEETAQQIDYTLYFKNGSSLFQAEPIMAKNPKVMKLAGSTGIYYNNFDKKERLRQLERGGEQFLISYIPLKWEIHEESKTINGFLCKKATSVRHFSKDIEQPIIAWFAPEIPASSGPIGFDGLPGLILDVTVAGEHFYATDIELNKEDILLEKPTKGEKVTYPDFQEKMNSMLEKI